MTNSYDRPKKIKKINANIPNNRQPKQKKILNKIDLHVDSFLDLLLFIISSGLAKFYMFICYFYLPNSNPAQAFRLNIE